MYHDSKTVVPLKEVLKAQQKYKPTCSIMYYTIQENQASDGEFTLEKQQHVLCVPQRVQTSDDEDQEGEVAAKPSQTNAGVLFPADAWSTSKYIHLIWATRWTATGLMPVRPQLMPKQDLVIKAHHGLKVL